MNLAPDPALPHLPTALDAQAMGVRFAAQLAVEGTAVLTACRIDRVKYRPRRNCSVSYQLTLRDGSGSEFVQGVATRWCSSAAEAEQRHDKAQHRAHRASRAGPALSHERALDMVAAWLPNDLKLDALTALLDDDTLRERALPEVAQALQPGARVRSHRTTLVQWVPEQRACARVALQLIGPHGVPSDSTLYVKTNAERSGAIAHGVMQALHANPRLLVPRSLAWQPAAGLHWQTAIEGRPLGGQNNALAPERAAQVGALIAQLHATPVPLPATRHISREDLTTRREVAAQAIAAALAPSQRASLDPLLRRLDDDADALVQDRPATLHGDLHRFNLLVTADDRLAVIDLDSVRCGPAALELGDWIAEAMFLALHDGRAAHSAGPSCRAMLQAYAHASGRALPEEAALAWATAHQLLHQRAYRCVANLKPGRLALVPALLRTASAIARARSLDVAASMG